jgi:hypothetical protein
LRGLRMGRKGFGIGIASWRIEGVEDGEEINK